MPEKSNFSTQTRIPNKNYILNALPEDEYQRLLPDLEPVQFTLGQIIYRAQEPIQYVYFPSNAMISVIAMTTEGQCAEVGVIGWEGMIGMDVLMGADSTINENVIQHPNGALRVNTAAIKREFKKAGVLHDLLLNFTRLMMIQIGQTALCNRLHTVEERLARWLLICRDRAKTDELLLTQEFLSMMLGVNRATVTLSAIALQSANYIKYSRGHITIINLDGLKDFACECYQIVKKEYDRVLQ